MNKKILFWTAFLGATLISSVMAYETVWQKEDSNHPTSTEKNQRASEIRQNMHEKVKWLQEEERQELWKVRELIKEWENEEARQIIQEYDFSQDWEDLLKRILQQSKRVGTQEKIEWLQEEERQELWKVRELIKEWENEEARQIIQEYDFSQDWEDLLKRILQQSKRVGIQERLKNLDENERQERVEIIKKIRDLIRDWEIEKAKELRMEYDFVPSPSDK